MACNYWVSEIYTFGLMIQKDKNINKAGWLPLNLQIIMIVVFSWVAITVD
jgi:hypothetical protein